MKISATSFAFGGKRTSSAIKQNKEPQNCTNKIKNFTRLKNSRYEYTKLAGAMSIGVGAVSVAVSKILIIPAVLFAGIFTLWGLDIDYKNNKIIKKK